jgi:hypothetical protein
MGVQLGLGTGLSAPLPAPPTPVAPSPKSVRGPTWGRGPFFYGLEFGLLAQGVEKGTPFR